MVPVDQKKIDENFGQRVRDARLRAGYSQRVLAEKIKISPQQISNIEHGKNPGKRVRVALEAWMQTGVLDPREGEDLRAEIRSLRDRDRANVEQIALLRGMVVALQEQVAGLARLVLDERDGRKQSDG